MGAHRSFRGTATAVARTEPTPRPTALKVFIARAEARAKLWQIGEISLHDAVDELQRAAEASGLVAELGQDEVQRLMVEAFAPLRDDLAINEDPSGATASFDDDESTFAAACHKADEKQRRKPTDRRLERLRRLLDDDVTLERASVELGKPDGVAESTLQTAEFLIQQNDADKFRKWLDRYSAQERVAIRQHLGRRGCHSRKSK
jgi:hypothetical protein